MLAKKYRLPIQAMIGKSGAVTRTPLFTIKVFSNSFPYCRFGSLVSKKVAARAVKRNQIRRIIFSVCGKFLKNSGGKDILIIALPPITKIDEKEMKTQLSNILEKVL